MRWLPPAGSCKEVPKALIERALPTLHLPNAEAKAVCDAWLTQSDKTQY